MSGWQLRPAGPDDAGAITGNVQAGFDSYVAFAPRGWAPPDVTDAREQTRALLGEPDTFALLACVEDAPVGHVSFFPGRERAAAQAPDAWRTRPLIPGLAHLWQLFVLAPWWGRGVADALHAAAVAEMRERAFTRARLYTPAAHVRARRFYERRGWSVREEAFHAGLALVLAEYRLDLGRAQPRAGETRPRDV